ncbi:hypothetical protein AVEN_158458-1 [Araneus ventricosus]|uniref:Uncharacterized protein n=1 Tax=Araneus ventricosus TaxID=182803 RepID=A0A4Y2UHI8_ARAVE|nr:hypothetical protein AVEN_158458-1 [Araneus ventricosus]
MEEGTRLRFGDLSSLGTNHREIIREPLPWPLNVRCLKWEEREKDGEMKYPGNTGLRHYSILYCGSRWDPTRLTDSINYYCLERGSGVSLLKACVPLLFGKRTRRALLGSLRAPTVCEEDQESPAVTIKAVCHEIHCSEGGHPSRICEKFWRTLKCVLETKPRRFVRVEATSASESRKIDQSSISSPGPYRASPR